MFEPPCGSAVRALATARQRLATSTAPRWGLSVYEDGSCIRASNFLNMNTFATKKFAMSKSESARVARPVLVADV